MIEGLSIYQARYDGAEARCGVEDCGDEIMFYPEWGDRDSLPSFSIRVYPEILTVDDTFKARDMREAIDYAIEIACGLLGVARYWLDPLDQWQEVLCEELGGSARAASSFAHLPLNTITK